MKKPKLPKISIKSSSVVGLINYLFLILLTSLILANVLIALPLTERISNLVAYDLETKTEKYWAKEYTLELNTQDLVDKQAAIQEVRNILDRRLTSIGVEKKTITSNTIADKDQVNIAVQTTENEMYVDELVRSPFRINIVTRKSDVNFEDEENPYAMYLGENYDSTPFTRETFRNIYITKLKNSANEYSYFALYKTWPWQTEWNTFITDYQGQTVGVSIDGFVTPIQVPTTVESFALPVSSTDKTEAKLVSILYNAGSMPIDYSLVSQQVLPVEQIESDYVKLTEGILLAVIAIYIYLLLIDRTPRSTLVVAGLSTLLTVSLWISYLKISGTSVDIPLLAIEIISIIAILRITTENKESSILVNVLLALISSVAIILGTGYVKLFAIDMLSIIILGIVAQQISVYYINKIKRVLKI